MCPFCLTTMELFKFRFEKGLRVCPVCTNQLRLDTLIKIQSIEEFVKFVFNYRFSGFWNKINYQIKDRDKAFDWFNIRLHDLGLSHDFWEKYKQLRGDSK